MPENTFAIVMFCAVSGLAFSGAVIRILAKKARRLRRQSTPFSHAFLTGAVTFSFVYFINRLSFPLRPKATIAVNLALLAGIFFFRVLRKKIRRLYRRRPKIEKNPHLRAEAAALEQMLKRDPLNAFCFEKLSEIYEKMGDRSRALEAAYAASRLDPTMKNQWRVEDLEKEIHGEKRVLPGARRK